MLFDSVIEKIRIGAEAGHVKAIDTYNALKDALNKKDPIGLRAAGRASEVPPVKSDVWPDFGWEAVEGEDSDDKKGIMAYCGIDIKGGILINSQAIYSTDIFRCNPH